MDTDAFRNSPVGDLVPITGHDVFLDRPYSHFAFVPRPLPASMPLQERTYKVVGEADRAIGRLDDAIDRLPNPKLLVRPTVYREAVSTSALEGTFAPLSAVLEADYVEEREWSSEVREVLNYVRAAERGIELLSSKPIYRTTIAELQQILVRGTRGDAYDAGDLRDRQVFIGERRSGIEGSRFVPPPPGDVLAEGFSDWEKWAHADDDVPLLVKIAVAHYQFETLHPFSDGNGRLGRLVVVLQLVEAGALTYPVLNLSPWLEPRKDEYKDLLLTTSQTGDFNPWVQFFAEAIRNQAVDAVERIDRLTGLRNEMVDALKAAKAKGVILDIAQDLIGYPILDATQAAALHHVTYPPANDALKRLEAMGFVTEITGGNYARRYACRAVLRVLDGDLDSR